MMFTLYIFKAAGSYFGGALGVVAETPLEALALVRQKRADYLEAYARWEEDYRAEEPARFPTNKVFLSREEAEADPDRTAILRQLRNHFLLAESFPLDQTILWQKRVVFHYFYEE